uniref:Uncharacterized protein n=1 Tax=Parascaris univalens TaxID=6257 RepID=A0A915AQ80_PARUN
LQHRQSALSLAGSKAMHMFTEIICNDQTLAMPDDATAMQKTLPVNQVTSKCSTVLVDKTGVVLYSYTGRDDADWPDVALLLENVRNHSNVQQNSTVKFPRPQYECDQKNEVKRNQNE